MTYKTFHVTHSLEGFELRLTENSKFRDTVADIADSMCVLSGHNFCHKFGAVWDWADRKSKVLYSMPIDRSAADKLSKNFWIWLDEDDTEGVD